MLIQRCQGLGLGGRGTGTWGVQWHLWGRACTRVQVTGSGPWLQPSAGLKLLLVLSGGQHQAVLLGPRPLTHPARRWPGAGWSDLRSAPAAPPTLAPAQASQAKNTARAGLSRHGIRLAGAGLCGHASMGHRLQRPPAADGGSRGRPAVPPRRARGFQPGKSVSGWSCGQGGARPHGRGRGTGVHYATTGARARWLLVGAVTAGWGCHPLGCDTGWALGKAHAWWGVWAQGIHPLWPLNRASRDRVAPCRSGVLAPLLWGQAPTRQLRPLLGQRLFIAECV